MIARQTTAEDYRRWLAFGLATSEYEKSLIDALTAEGSDASVKEIVTFLQHEDSDVVAHAARVLADKGADEAIPALRDLLSSREDEHLLRAVRSALSKLEEGRTR